MPCPTTQETGNPAVSCDVSSYLLPPFFCVGLWGNVFSTPVSMPKTTINKDR
jgi:hypothetical protein